MVLRGDHECGLDVERMHEDMTVTVRFDNVAGEQTMKVETIGDTKATRSRSPWSSPPPAT